MTLPEARTDFVHAERLAIRFPRNHWVQYGRLLCYERWLAACRAFKEWGYDASGWLRNDPGSIGRRKTIYLSSLRSCALSHCCSAFLYDADSCDSGALGSMLGLAPGRGYLVKLMVHATIVGVIVLVTIFPLLRPRANSTFPPFAVFLAAANRADVDKNHIPVRFAWGHFAFPSSRGWLSSVNNTTSLGNAAFTHLTSLPR